MKRRFSWAEATSAGHSAKKDPKLRVTCLRDTWIASNPSIDRSIDEGRALGKARAKRESRRYRLVPGTLTAIAMRTLAMLAVVRTTSALRLTMDLFEEIKNYDVRITVLYIFRYGFTIL